MRKACRREALPCSPSRTAQTVKLATGAQALRSRSGREAFCGGSGRDYRLGSHQRHKVAKTVNAPPKLSQASFKKERWQGRRPRFVERRLYAILVKLQPKARRALIESHLSQPQRLALERWILDQGSALLRRSADRRQASSKNHIPWGHWLQLAAMCGRGLRKSDFGMEAARWRSWNQSCAGYEGDPHMVPCKRSRLGSHNEAAAVNLSDWRGISRRFLNGLPAYAAVVTVKKFQVSTKSTHVLSDAYRFREVLLAIRHRVVSAWVAARRMSSASVGGEVAAADAFEEAFRKAVVEEPAKWDLDPLIDMGLSFAASAEAHRWLGRRLSTPRFPVSRLDVGLHACRKLDEAREALRCSIGASSIEVELSRLRCAFIDAWVQAGKDSEEVMAQLAAWQEARNVRHAGQQCDAIVEGSVVLPCILPSGVGSCGMSEGVLVRPKGLGEALESGLPRSQGAQSDGGLAGPATGAGSCHDDTDGPEKPSEPRGLAELGLLDASLSGGGRAESCGARDGEKGKGSDGPKIPSGLEESDGPMTAQGLERPSAPVMLTSGAVVGPMSAKWSRQLVTLADPVKRKCEQRRRVECMLAVRPHSAQRDEDF